MKTVSKKVKFGSSRFYKRYQKIMRTTTGSSDLSIISSIIVFVINRHLLSNTSSCYDFDLSWEFPNTHGLKLLDRQMIRYFYNKRTQKFKFKKKFLISKFSDHFKSRKKRLKIYKKQITNDRSMALEFRKVLLSTPGNVICEQKTDPPRKSVKSFVLYVSLRRKSKAYNTKSKFEQFLVFSYFICT